MSRFRSSLHALLSIGVFAVALAGAPATAADKDINVVEQSADDNGFLPAAAGHFPNPVRATSKADLATKVLAQLGPGDCIKTLRLVGHGFPGNISTGDGQGHESCKHVNGNSAEWKPALAGLKGKFCAGAKIVLWGCNTGADAKGAAKLKELADYFGVPVEAQTGSVYGDGTTETGSTTVTGRPGQPAPTAVAPPSGACKKKPKKGVETLGLVTFPNAGTYAAPVAVALANIVSVSVAPAELLPVVFQPIDWTPIAQPEPGTPQPIGTTKPNELMQPGRSARLSADGQRYLAANAITSPSVIQQLVQGVVSTQVKDTTDLGAEKDGAVLFQLASGQVLTYYSVGLEEYLVTGGDSLHTLETTCDGSVLVDLLLHESLATTIARSGIADEQVDAGYEWVVDLDLDSFFDRVPRERLMARLGQRVQDARLLGLIRRMLNAKVVLPDGVVVSTQEGVPQGGPLSPLLSNIVLDELDWELARRGHHFVRYADDCNIYVRTERAGRRVMASVTRFIERRLRLKVNVSKSAVARPEDRHFLGFRLRRDPLSGEVEVLLSKRSKDRIDRKIRELTPRNWGQSLSACIGRLNTYLLGWLGFFQVITEAEERTLQGLDGHIRRRLRAIVLKHWKRRRTIVRRLTRLGAKASAAGMAVYRQNKSWWALSLTRSVNKALSGAYFRDRHLLSVKEHWRKLRDQSVIGPGQLTLDLG